MQAQDPPTLCHGRYRLLEILGEGGMAVVYRAFDEHLRVDRAVKLLVPAAVRIPEARARLETEARAMAGLHHPNVVSVYDIRRDDKELFLVMELLSGGTLWDWVRAYGPMPPRLAVQVMLPVLSAVQAAHGAGIVHRDLKPQNIMLDATGAPKVADFGIAHVRTLESDGSFTRTGTVLGTWAFMAPEQRQSARQVDERSDLYALGATLYSLVTAEPPFDLFAADQDSRLLAGIPVALAAIIRQATRYDPDQRYPDTEAMSQVLRRALPDLDSVPEGTPELGVAPAVAHDAGGMTAGFTTGPEDMQTGGPAADLIFGRRELHSTPFEDDTVGGGPDLPLGWKLGIILAPALLAALAGGLVMVLKGPESLHQSAVELTGDALDVRLLDAGGLAHPLDTLDPGLYRIEARFEGTELPVDAGRVQVPEGAHLTLRCDAVARRCEPEPEPEPAG
jgi:tRNA A-37 threonylcarbamoyl transferase component Bud32